MSSLAADDGVLQEALRSAIGYHRAGNLAAAEGKYREILAISPRQSDANHNLGLLDLRNGRAAEALAHFQAALQADPRQAQFWLSCIGALIQLGQTGAASEMLAQARRCGLGGPDAEALEARVGALSSPHTERRPEEAKISSVPASTPFPVAASRPDLSPGANKMRKRGQRAKDRAARSRQLAFSPAVTAGSAKQEAEDEAMLMGLYRQGRFAEVEALARGLAAKSPARGFLWKVLGAAVQQQKRYKEALEMKLRAAELLPGDAEMQNNLGNALLKLSSFAEAEACYRRATAWSPEYPEPWSGLGLAAQKQGRLEEAEQFCRRALELRPIFADGSCNLGVVLQFRDKLDEAEACYRAALDAEPSHLHALSNFGTLLQKMGRLAEAEDLFRRALAQDPDFVDSLANLAGCLHQLGRMEEAIAAHRRSIEVDPASDLLYSNYLFCLAHQTGCRVEDQFAEQLRFGQRFESPLVGQWRPHPNSRDPERPLHIGFVSGDFYKHAMACFVEPMLTQLGRDPGFVLHVYNCRSLEDEITLRMRTHVRHWTSSAGLSPEVLAEKARADGIDILFDLCGHTGGSPLAFARKPAPIQIGWIGYLGSSGMKCMDYYLADPVFLPPGEFDRFFSETIVRLPAVTAFQTSLSAPPVSALPAFANGHLTFGSFSRMGKLNPETVALWSRLLRELPGSRMVLGAMPSHGRSELLEGWFAQQGIAKDRLDFHSNTTIGLYFELHRGIDLCLDPVPFTGATTTGNAIWMGVPTLTLQGNTPPGRLGPAMLRHAGLEDFVARDPDDFVAKGLHWANNLEVLAQLRAGMRARFLNSPLGQPEIFGRELSALLRRLWADWCEQSPPVARNRRDNLRS